MIWAHAPVEFPAAALGPGAPRWVMAIAFPERVLLGQVLELSRLYLVLFVALALAAVVGYRLARHLIGPLEALTSEADAIAAGDLGRRLRIEGTDEIARLGERFNAMSARLQATLLQLQGQRDRLEIEVGERTRDLAAERARLAAVLRNASDAIAAVGCDGALLLANRAAERLLAPPEDPFMDMGRAPPRQIARPGNSEAHAAQEFGMARGRRIHGSASSSSTTNLGLEPESGASAAQAVPTPVRRASCMSAGASAGRSPRA